MRGNVEDMRAIHVAPPEDEGGGDVALVAKEHAFEQRARRHDARLALRVHPQEFQLAADEVSRLLRIRGSPSPAAVYVVSNVMDLLAVFLGDGSIVCGTRIRSEHDTTVKYHTDDGCAGLRSRGQGTTRSRSPLEHFVTHRVFERETGWFLHRGPCMGIFGHFLARYII